MYKDKLISCLLVCYVILFFDYQYQMPSQKENKKWNYQFYHSFKNIRLNDIFILINGCLDIWFVVIFCRNRISKEDLCEFQHLIE